MNPAARKTLKTIFIFQVAGYLMAGVGVLTLILAGPETSVGRAAVYVTLALAALMAGLGMAFGYSLPWAAFAKTDKTPAPNSDGPREPS